MCRMCCCALFLCKSLCSSVIPHPHMQTAGSAAPSPASSHLLALPRVQLDTSPHKHLHPPSHSKSLQQHLQSRGLDSSRATPLRGTVDPLTSRVSTVWAPALAVQHPSGGLPTPAQQSSVRITPFAGLRLAQAHVLPSAQLLANSHLPPMGESPPTPGSKRGIGSPRPPPRPHLHVPHQVCSNTAEAVCLVFVDVGIERSAQLSEKILNSHEAEVDSSPVARRGKEAGTVAKHVCARAHLLDMMCHIVC